MKDRYTPNTTKMLRRTIPDSVIQSVLNAPSPIPTPTIYPSPDFRQSGFSSDGNPDDADHNIQSLLLPSLILETPHTIRLLVPVCAGGRVHSTATHVRLAICVNGLALLLRLGLDSWLVQRCCGHEVLDDGAVDGILVAWGAARGGGFGNEGL